MIHPKYITVFNYFDYLWVMTSYQKLKAKNAELHKEIHKLITNEEYWITKNLTYSVAKQVDKAVWFGSGTGGRALGHPTTTA